MLQCLMMQEMTRRLIVDFSYYTFENENFIEVGKNITIYRYYCHPNMKIIDKYLPILNLLLFILHLHHTV